MNELGSETPNVSNVIFSTGEFVTEVPHGNRLNLEGRILRATRLPKFVTSSGIETPFGHKSTEINSQKSRRNGFAKTGEFEGYVTDVCIDSFTAELTSIRSEESTLIVTFDLEDLATMDRQELQIGAELRVLTGYMEYDGTRNKSMHVSLIRRIPEPRVISTPVLTPLEA